MTRRFMWAVLGAIFTARLCCAESDQSSKPESKPGLPRVLKVSDRIFTGYEPLGSEGFDSLKSLGIKTIISVDGAIPNVEAAKAHGIDYIHIPFGYDGVPEEAQKAIFEVMKNREGPFYFHCHHGQHRGPAAAAIALRIDSGCSAETAIGVLKTCGTGADYKGLYKSVSEFKTPVDVTHLPELHEISKVEDLAGAMARIDRIWDRLLLLQKNNWQAPKDNPDLSAEHEALMLGESFRTAARLNVDKDGKEDMWLRIKETESFAFHLRDAFKANDADGITARFTSIKSNCMNCHSQYRNNIIRPEK